MKLSSGARLGLDVDLGLVVGGREAVDRLEQLGRRGEQASEVAGAAATAAGRPDTCRGGDLGVGPGLSVGLVVAPQVRRRDDVRGVAEGVGERVGERRLDLGVDGRVDVSVRADAGPRPVSSTATGSPSHSSPGPASRSRYSAERSSSSSWVPSAATRPPSTSTMRWASCSVERRWATTIVVRPAMTSRSVAWICSSVRVSTDEVASSRISTVGSVTSARAIATRWRCPPESVRPRSPTTVSYPSGNAVMKSWAPAARAAASTSARVASGRPYAMLLCTESEKRKLSSKTTPMLRRSESSVTSRRSMPSTVIAPSWMS